MLKVNKNTLIIISGLIWSLVGLFLIFKSCYWIDDFPQTQLYIIIFVGIIIAVLKFIFIFRKTTKHNIDRIMNLDSTKCNIFAFHSFRFYFIILLMIIGGILLRRIDIIPVFILYPIYLGIGLAMFFSSFKYFKFRISKK